MGLPQCDIAYYTYSDYLRWPEEVRYELIGGSAYLMAAPNRVHQEILGEIYYQVRGKLEGKPCRVYIAPFDVRLPNANEADEHVDTVVQPDLLVVCDPTKLDERGLRGAPEWVVEVLSPTTAAYDQTVKLAAYEYAGVPEVWLIHPTDQIVTIYRLKEKGYSRPLIYQMQGILAVTTLPDIGIDWERVRPFMMSILSRISYN
ncbi:Uma2 family endonuclease [Gammaproteobacteria bacterium]